MLAGPYRAGYDPVLSVISFCKKLAKMNRVSWPQPTRKEYKPKNGICSDFQNQLVSEHLITGPEFTDDSRLDSKTANPDVIS